MASKLNVEVIVGLVDRLTRPLQGLQRNLSRTMALTANMTFVGHAMSQAGQGMVRPLADAARAAMRFESALADVKKVVDFESPNGLKTLEDTLERLSRSIPLTAEQLAEIAAAGGQLGLGAGDLPAYVETVAKAATAFDMLPSAAGEAFAKLSNVFGMPIARVGSLGDAVNHLSNNLAATAPGIVDALSRIGGSAKGFGLSAQQAAGYAAAMLALGETSETAGTSLNFMLTRLQTATKQGKKFQGALADMGLSAETLAAGISTDANAALQDFIGRLSQMKTSARMGALVDLFGVEHAPKLAKLAGNTEMLAKAMGLVAHESAYAGSMQAEFAARSATTANGFILLTNRVAELKRAIGEALLPVLTDLATWAGDIVTRLKEWADAHPRLARAMAIAAGAMAVMMVVGGTLITAIGGIVGSLAMLGLMAGGPLRLLGGGLRLIASLAARVGPAIRGMALALSLVQGGSLAKVLFVVRALGAALLATPVGWLVAALAGGALLIRKYWEPISGFFRGLWAGITEGLGPLAPAFESAWGAAATVMRPVVDALGSVWDWLKQLLTPIQGVGQASEDLGRRWGAAIAGMVQRVGELLAAFLALPGQLATIGGQIIDGLWRGISERWKALKARVASIADGIAGVFRKETDTHSPSRVFARLGGDLMAGLALGLEQRMGVPLAQMQALTAGLTRTAGAVTVGGALALSPAAAPAAPAAPAVQAAPITIHVTINAAPGTDAPGLARLARRELTAAAERVAALYDRSDDR